MNDDSRLYGVSMRGWICLVLTLALSASVLMKIPIDTQFFTIINSVLVAYVVQSRSQQQTKKENEKSNGNVSSGSS